MRSRPVAGGSLAPALPASVQPMPPVLPAPAPSVPSAGQLLLPFGPIGVRYQDRQLLQVCLSPGATWPDAPLPPWLVAEFLAYLRAPGHRIALDARCPGTPFQQRVWAAIAAIPPGQTRTYGALAQDLRSSPRAVGNACRANPVPLLVPCHRVVAVRGLGGFAGAQGGHLRAIKRWLLAHEGSLAAVPDGVPASVRAAPPDLAHRPTARGARGPRRGRR